ncbi:hypothetical protein QTP86_023235, partial [Hemibagrus guttatus]
IPFFVISSPTNPIILGFPWPQCPDPCVSWKEGELTRWLPYCMDHCLKNVLSRPCLATSIESPSTAEITVIPQEYHELHEVFSKERATQLPHHCPCDCATDLLSNVSPPKCKVYPLSLPESKAMEDYIKEALAAGYIRPLTLPVAAGFFFVKKKDGGLRPCIDYRGLNAITVLYPYPLPLVLAALEQLREAWVFTKLNYTWYGSDTNIYEYLVMPHGLVNAPAVLQACINEIFKADRYVITYIDDISIYSTSHDGHIHHVRMVLAQLLQHQLYVNAKKCDVPGLSHLPEGSRNEFQQAPVHPLLKKYNLSVDLPHMGQTEATTVDGAGSCSLHTTEEELHQSTFLDTHRPELPVHCRGGCQLRDRGRAVSTPWEPRLPLCLLLPAADPSRSKLRCGEPGAFIHQNGPGGVATLEGE